MPDPARLLATLRRAIDLTRTTPGRHGRLVDVSTAHDVLVGGDLHGHLPHFRSLMEHADLRNQSQRHLLLQEVIHSPFRYPRGGDKSHQLLDLYAALKCQFPERVHLLMGNHEMAQWTGRPIVKDEEDFNQLFREGVEQVYAPRDQEIYDAYLALFAVLPLAVRVSNRVFVSHSVPAPKYLATFDPALLRADDVAPEHFQPKGALYGLVWGRDTSADHVAAFLERVDADWLITGHIVCDEGFSSPNERQLILDCAHSPAAYCLFPADRALNGDDLVSSVHRI